MRNYLDLCCKDFHLCEEVRIRGLKRISQQLILRSSQKMNNYICKSELATYPTSWHIVYLL